MNTIGTGNTAILASPAAALTPVGPQGVAQKGTAALAYAPQTNAIEVQDSAQTELSALALVLNAIIGSGSEATPAVVGRAPLWANPDVDAPEVVQPLAQSSAALLSLPGPASTETEAAQLAESALPADTESGVGGQAATTPQIASAQASQTGQSGPVAALAASLAQTVGTSGLFYEAHLAQWFFGQRSPAELADDYQNRLVSGNAQTSTAPPGDAQGGAHANAANTAAARALPDLRAGEALQPARALLADARLPATHDTAALATGTSVQPAVIPLVRQQLDLLATGEFRWTGEAWPGAQVEWSIQQDQADSRDSRRASGGEGTETPWRTRLTLALPGLGAVDAQLTLTGEALALRVQASAVGAARLTVQSGALRGRLEALGLTLAGLSIHEVGAGASASPIDAAEATSV